MVYINSWEEFQKASEELYSLSPFKCRYTSKYRVEEGLLVLKVWDDETCLKYKTREISDLKRFDRLNTSLMRRMTNIKPPNSAVSKMEVDDVVSSLMSKVDLRNEASLSQSLAANSEAVQSQQQPTSFASSSKKKKKGKKNRT